jgi:hypothetical protein
MKGKKQSQGARFSRKYLDQYDEFAGPLEDVASNNTPCPKVVWCASRPSVDLVNGEKSGV